MNELRGVYFDQVTPFFFAESHRLRLTAHYNKEFLLPFQATQKAGDVFQQTIDLQNLDVKIERALTTIETTGNDGLQSLFDRMKDHFLRIGSIINGTRIQTIKDEDKQVFVAITTTFIELHDKAVNDFLDLFLDADANNSKYDLLFEKIKTELDAFDMQIKDTNILNILTGQSDNDAGAGIGVAPERSSIQLINDVVATTHRLSGSASPSGTSWVGGFKRYSSKIPSYKYYLKAFKSYSKRKLKTFRKRRNYKKTKRNKH
jgi:hypothetical protein